MPTFPLITHDSPQQLIAWRDGAPITAARFLADVERVRVSLPAGVHMLNACADRYRFMVGLAAAITAGKTSLLPSTQTPEMMRHLLQFAPDAFCLADVEKDAHGLPVCRFPDLDGMAAVDVGKSADRAVPQIDATQCVAYVFTSGSTGTPLPHAKRWGALVANVQAEARLCGLADGRAHAVIGTVPPQHMYGFESTVLIVMQSGNALVAGNTFYPADICRAVASVPRPRMLVSTPIHLRSVLSAGLPLPPVDRLMSATAPLSPLLAQEAEAAFGAPLVEIYGSTESGQIALRESVRTQEWQLFPDLRFVPREGVHWVEGGHVETPTPMNDVIEMTAPQRFLLHGRMADLVNIAGKRNSLANLNLQLNALPGVVDGAFYMPDEEGADAVTRLAAFVVAPGVAAADILHGLRQRMDPVFLPRPLVFVDALPRNATGKLPREALRDMAATLTRTREGRNASEDGSAA
ncbi:AMP-binding protein [Noviherbaspirillum pedocola]|uniref:AMP-binding protein n=1 Tax=Noviherbaspirillum pedocola TaxID=2801341 RepID=UPI002D7F7C98|nr:AMP-binding protein [Noviherbaspirillum pedocola]